MINPQSPLRVTSEGVNVNSMNTCFQVFVIVSILGLLSCQRGGESIDQSDVQQSNEALDTAQADSAVHTELMYRFKDDVFAEELQQLFSEYYTRDRDRKDTRSLFDSESQKFMRWPQVSQSLSLFYDGRFFDVHKPMIIAIYTEGNDTIAKLNFTRVDSLDVATSMATVNFGITKSGDQLKLQNMVYLNSRNWETKHVGNIEYRFPKTHPFALETAKKMQEFNLYAAQLFQTEPIEIKYYICESNIELGRLQGFDFKYDMYNMNNSSGLTDVNHNIIYAGNGSEYYPHELVHLYTYKWEGVPRYHEWFDEGLATYLGGSRDQPLEWHLSGLAEWLEQNESVDLSDPFSLPRQINDNTGSMYVIGGLICKLAFEKGGMDAIKKLFLAGPNDEDFYKGIEEVFGVKKEELNDFLRTSL